MKHFPILLCMCGMAYAQIISPAGDDSNGFPINSDDFKYEYEMGYGSEMPTYLELSYSETNNGLIVYRQFDQGIPVFGSKVIDKGSDYFFRILPEKRLWLLPEITAEEKLAGEAAVLSIVAAELNTTDFQYELVIMPYRHPRLIWRVTVPSLLKEDRLYIDAKSFKLLVREQAKVIPIHIQPADAGREDTSPTSSSGGGEDDGTPPVMLRGPDLSCPQPQWSIYGTGTGHTGQRCFPAKKTDCCLGLGWYTNTWAFINQLYEIKTYEYPNDWTGPPEEPINKLLNGYLGESVVFMQDFGIEHKSAVDAHALLWQVSEFWKDTSSSPGSSRSFPKNNQKIRAIVKLPPAHFPENYASYSLTDNLFLFNEDTMGTGLPFVSDLDTVAHEYAHALLETFPALSESSALTEGFADAMAVAAEAGLRPGAWNWRMGEHAGLNRDISNPTSSGGIMYRENFFEYNERNDTQHQGGTVLGLAFFLLANGGSHPNNEKWPGPSVAGIGLANASNIFYEAFTNRFTSTSQFSDVRRDCIAEASSAMWKQSVNDAFRAVGVAPSRFLRDDEEQTTQHLDRGKTAYYRFHVSSSFPEGVAFLVFNVTGPGTNEYVARAQTGYFPHAIQSQATATSNQGVVQMPLVAPLTAGDKVYFSIEATEPCDDLNVTINVVTIDFNILMNAVPTLNQSGSTGENLNYQHDNGNNRQLRVVGETRMQVDTSGGTGDADLYLRLNGPASPENYDYRDTGSGNNHQILVVDPQPGTWWVGVYGVTDFSGVTVTAETRNDTDLLPPDWVIASDGNAGGIFIQWDSVADAIGYTLYLAESETGVKYPLNIQGTNTSFNDYSVDPGTIYYYWVTAKSNVFESDFSEFDTGFASPATLPNPPSSVHASNGNYPDHVTISHSWAPNGNNGGNPTFKFYRSNSPGSTKSYLGFSGGSYSDYGVTPGITYYYWVKTQDNHGTSAYSEYDSGYASSGILTPPGNVIASDDLVERVVLTWDAVANASEYAVYYSHSPTGNQYWIDKTDTTSFVFQGYTAVNRTLYYWVKAINGGQYSGFSDYDAGFGMPSALPQAPSWVDASEHISIFIKVDWDTVGQQNANYKVFRSPNEFSAPTLLTETYATPYYDHTAEFGQTYYYRIIAGNVLGESGYSPYDTGSRLTMVLPLPVHSLGASDGEAQGVSIHFAWSGGSQYGNPEFRIYRSETATGQKTYLGSGNRFFDDSGNPDQIYYYWVKVFNEAGSSDYTGPDSGWYGIFNAPPAPTGLTATTHLTDRVDVNWNPSPDADSYYLYRGTTQSNLTWVAEIQQGTSYQDTRNSLINWPNYYSVRAARANLTSGYSSTDVGMRMPTALPPQPSWCTASDDNGNSVRIDYDTTGQENPEYKIFRSTTPTGSGSLIRTTRAPYNFDYTATPGQLYYYWVVATNVLGESSPSPKDSGVRP